MKKLLIRIFNKKHVVIHADKFGTDKEMINHMLKGGVVDLGMVKLCMS